MLPARHLVYLLLNIPISLHLLLHIYIIEINFNASTIRECVLIEDGLVSTVLLSKGHGLLPGRLSGSNWYLDRQIFMEVNGRASNENRKYLCSDNDSMSSGVISAIGDRGSGTKPWTC